jgi:tripartite-type tricarboxylate transporter receptor subunit TctC
MQRRKLVQFAAATAATTLVTRAGAQASAAKFPDKPIRIVVPFPPGGPADRLARPLAQQMNEKFGQPVLIENRPGANTVIGAQNILNSPADGHSLILANEAGMCLAPALAPIMGSTVPYKADRDFAAISLLVQYGSVMSMYPGLPVRTLKEFIEHARRNPGKLSYASVGVGSQPQMMMEILKKSLNLDIAHVPYQGVAPAVLDLMAGRVQVMISAPAAPSPHIKGGKLVGLAYSGSQRLQTLAEVPTFTEAGLPDFEARGWFGIMAHGATPGPIRSLLSETIWAIAQSAEYGSETIRAQGLEPATISPAGFTQFLAKDVASWQLRIESIKDQIRS